MSDKDLYRLTNPAFAGAVGTLFNLYYAGRDEAKALMDELEMNPEELLSEEQKQTSFALVNQIINEARYDMINNLLKEAPQKIILDIGCGYNPKALTGLLDEKTYIGGDLPAIIRDIKPAFETLLKEKEGREVRHEELDITSYDTLKEALENTEGEVLILTDSVLLYLFNPELKMAANNIKKILEEWGGVWLTPDPEYSKYYFGIMKALYGDEGLKRMDAMYSSSSKENDVSVGTNKMSIMPWNVEEDTRKVKNFLKDLGLQSVFVPGEGALPGTAEL